MRLNSLKIIDMKSVVLVYTNDKENVSKTTKLRIATLNAVGYTVKIVDSNDWKSTQGLKVSGIIIDDLIEEY